MNPQFKGLENAWSSADRSLRVMESQRQHPLRTRSFQWKVPLVSWVLGEIGELEPPKSARDKRRVPVKPHDFPGLQHFC